MKKVILASASPRRCEILNQVGIDAVVMPSDCEEVITKEIPAEVVEELSCIKAEYVANQTLEEDIETTILKEKGLLSDDRLYIVGSDTVVVIDNDILGKPADEKHAFKMISRIQGTFHQVYTGVTIVVRVNKTIPSEQEYINRMKDKKIRIVKENDDYILMALSFNADTKVYVNSMTDKEIDEYVSTNEPYDKAGSYAVQGIFAKHIQKLDGDYFNVMGLPISKVYDELKVLEYFED